MTEVYIYCFYMVFCDYTQIIIFFKYIKLRTHLGLNLRINEQSDEPYFTMTYLIFEASFPALFALRDIPLQEHPEYQLALPSLT